MSWDLKARRFVERARLDPLTAHASWRVIFTEEMKERLYADGAAVRHDSLDLLRVHSANSSMPTAVGARTTAAISGAC